MVKIALVGDIRLFTNHNYNIFYNRKIKDEKIIDRIIRFPVLI